MNASAPLAAGRETSGLHVGDWLVEPARNQISRGPLVVRLEPKTIEVLTYLAQRSGQVVSREELLGALWPGVIVGDESLTQAIIKLRKALGDQARQPAYIETISKRGYRLIAPVRAQQAPQPGARGAGEPVTPATTGRHDAIPSGSRLTQRAGLASLAAAVAALAIWLLMHESNRNMPGANTAIPVDADAHPTIAVERLRALGDDVPQMLLAAGITADLVHDLSKISGLRVMNPANESNAVPSVAPSARYLVSGDVQRAEGRLRVRVHLADRESGRTLWAERFDRPLADLFALQDELTRQIMRALPVRVTEEEARRAAQRYTRNLKAYELFQSGQLAATSRREADSSAAREMYLRAIQLDPAFARAYAAMAVTHARDHRYGLAQDGPAVLIRALELAKTARQIDPNLPEACFALAYVYVHRREHAAALDEVETALRLNPSYADAYALKAHIYLDSARPAEAIPLVRTAMRLSPQGAQLYFLLLGRAYFFLDDSQQAQINLREAVSRNPADLEAHAYLAATLARAGDAGGAGWEATEIRSIQPSFRVAAWLDTYPMTDTAQKKRLAAALAALGF